MNPCFVSSKFLQEMQTKISSQEVNKHTRNLDSVLKTKNILVSFILIEKSSLF